MLSERLMTIGRGSEADIQIDEPSASRRHAAIERTPEGFVLRDLGSTNGTYHGGLLHGRETPLRQGDCFRIGDTEFLFQDDGEIP
jgi:pSer/pThr/pTyr-binding forkhead associated (FHA) protein